MWVAELSVVRMQDQTNPMPPVPASAATSGEIATLQNWIAAGYPMGSCGGGADGGAGAVAPPDPYGTPIQCSSNMYWKSGSSSTMRPGEACIACHSKGDGPKLAIAGTVYPTAHEPDRCDGAMSGQVVITDANGKTVTLAPNAAGNFSYQGTIAMPYHAKVVENGAERVMSAGQTSGDCNSCHTVTGANGAPGRIMLP
jgi:hypothetical protein